MKYCQQEAARSVKRVLFRVNPSSSCLEDILSIRLEYIYVISLQEIISEIINKWTRHFLLFSDAIDNYISVTQYLSRTKIKYNDIMFEISVPNY